MLPAAASLKKQGASRGAISAFLISTPESGVDSIAVTYALLDPLMTVIRPVAAFITAIAAGFLENSIVKPGVSRDVKQDLSCPVDNCCDGNNCDPEQHKKHHTKLRKLVAGIEFGIVDVWGDIVAWFFTGLVIAGVITAMVPDDLMSRYLGGGMYSMFIMLIVGVPIYICATASTPVAAALILKGVSPGAALVFLLAGPATNITSLSTLLGIMGKKATIRYLLVLSLFSVLFGMAVDQIYMHTDIVASAVMGEASKVVPHELKFWSAIVLLVISTKPLYHWLKKKLSKKKPESVFYSSFQDIADHHKKG